MRWVEMVPLRRSSSARRFASATFSAALLSLNSVETRFRTPSAVV